MGTRKVGGPNYSVFFSSPAANFVFPSLSGGLLVELWPQFKAVVHPKCAFELFWGHFVRASVYRPRWGFPQ